MHTGKRIRLGLAVAFVVHLLATRAAADPAPSERLRMRDPSTLTLKSGRVLELPPGRFIAEIRFEEDEAELKRLQATETRLKAENASLRGSASGWRPGWKTIASTFIAGFALGVYIAK